MPKKLCFFAEKTKANITMNFSAIVGVIKAINFVNLDSANNTFFHQVY